ncbi:hypothetical protein PBY51_020345 [Eleginops maclovinus]|uniref:SEA domain-containing protein n=1 Tax=Eleginops maclovinus TaxID=56733 RepID=A0AAN7XLN0_ELEMC|nr:hypothetical protein PBY51_020345 [Eleginops maclovinus]
MQQTFTPQLANKSSSEFIELKNKVKTALDKVYSEQYGSSFNRTVINSFSQGSVVVDAELRFNKVTTLPNATSVVSTLATASSSSNFSLNVNTSSISATIVSTLAAEVVKELNRLCTNLYGPDFVRSVVNAFTSGSVVADTTIVFKDTGSVPSSSTATTQLSSALTSNSTSLNIISGSVSATSSSTASTATPAVTAAPTAAPPTDPPTSSEGTLGLQFSLDQTFTSDLSDSSSTAYKTLAATVISEVNKVAQKLYGGSFLRSILNKFTSGSVKADMTLVYKNKTSTPTASIASSDFSTALSSSSLNVIQGSVSAQSTSTSSSPPRPTTGSLVVFSLTLLAVALMLTN